MCLLRESVDDFIILLLCVENMLLVGQNREKMGKLNKGLSKSFSIKDLDQQVCASLGIRRMEN